MDYVEGADTAQLLRSRYPTGVLLEDAVEVNIAIAEGSGLLPRSRPAAPRRKAREHSAHRTAQR
jgi:hypothetical protein